jgi:hypothetical protein
MEDRKEQEGKICMGCGAEEGLVSIHKEHKFCTKCFFENCKKDKSGKMRTLTNSQVNDHYLLKEKKKSCPVPDCIEKSRLNKLNGLKCTFCFGKMEKMIFIIHQNGTECISTLCV